MHDDYQDALWFAQAYQQDPEAINDALREVVHDREEEELAAYDAVVDEIAAANPDIDPDQFHRFVHMAEGDFDQAIDYYRNDAALREQATQRQLRELEQLAGRTAGASPGRDLDSVIDDLVRRRP